MFETVFFSCSRYCCCCYCCWFCFNFCFFISVCIAFICETLLLLHIGFALVFLLLFLWCALNQSQTPSPRVSFVRVWLCLHFRSIFHTWFFPCKPIHATISWRINSAGFVRCLETKSIRTRHHCLSFNHNKCTIKIPINNNNKRIMKSEKETHNANRE